MWERSRPGDREGREGKIYKLVPLLSGMHVASYPGRGHGNQLQYSCLGNPIDRGTWQASPWSLKRVGHDGVTKRECMHGFLLLLNSKWVLGWLTLPLSNNEREKEYQLV